MNYKYEVIDDTMAHTICQQCGMHYEFHRRYLNRSGAWWLCKSCKAEPMKICRYGDDWCTPWQGEFDIDLLVCLDDDGIPTHLGKRTCGHWDCIRPEHLIP